MDKLSIVIFGFSTLKSANSLTCIPTHLHGWVKPSAYNVPMTIINMRIAQPYVIKYSKEV